MKEGYHADIVVIDPNSSWEVNADNILYKCGWSPFEGETFSSKVTHTFVNGCLVYENEEVKEIRCGQRLLFER